jgi:hypothetical protein
MTIQKRITIHVTREDINTGVPHSTVGCPIAHALNRALPKLQAFGGTSLAALVTSTTISAAGMYAVTTDRAREFISDYDHGIAVVPARFTFVFRGCMTEVRQ